MLKDVRVTHCSVALSPHRFVWVNNTDTPAALCVTGSSSAFRDLQLMLSEALERPEPLSRKQRLEKARRGALYGQNPTGLFRRPEPKNQPIRNK